MHWMRACPASALHTVYLRDPLKLQIDLINDRTQFILSMNLFPCKFSISFSFQIWYTLQSRFSVSPVNFRDE